MFYPLSRFVEYVFAHFFPARHDGNPSLRYFNPTEYGAKCLPFSFLSGENRLNGGRYYVDGPFKGLVVFFHGAGAGHEAYGELIASIAKQGYLVYAYDNTGCMQSEGKDCNGLAQPLVDQAAFFDFLEKDDMAKGLRRFSVGHSWGGYASLGCLQEQYQVEKIVCISGFDSAVKMASYANEKTRKAEKIIYKFLKDKYGPLGVYDGLSMMKKTEKDVLLIYGENDNTVDPKLFFHVYEEETKDNPHIEFLRVKNRGHQPYWSEEAQNYFISYFRDKNPKKVLDYSRLTQDEEVLQTLFDFLGR